MQKSTTPKSRKKYDESFKKEVLKMVADGRPIREVSQTLSIGENLIYKWRSRGAGVSPVPASIPDDVDLVLQNQELKTLLRKAEEERDILKKALLIFGRQT